MDCQTFRSFWTWHVPDAARSKCGTSPDSKRRHLSVRFTRLDSLLYKVPSRMPCKLPLVLQCSQLRAIPTLCICMQRETFLLLLLPRNMNGMCPVCAHVSCVHVSCMCSCVLRVGIRNSTLVLRSAYALRNPSSPACNCSARSGAACCSSPLKGTAERR